MTLPIFNLFYPVDQNAARIEPLLFESDCPPEPVLICRRDLSMFFQNLDVVNLIFTNDRKWHLTENVIFLGNSLAMTASKRPLCRGDTLYFRFSDSLSGSASLPNSLCGTPDFNGKRKGKTRSSWNLREMIQRPQSLKLKRTESQGLNRIFYFFSL